MKSKEKFIKLSADSTFSILGLVSKRKCGIGRKFFTTCFIASWTSLISSKGLLKLLEYIRLLHSLASIFFYIEKENHYSYLSFQKKVN